MQRYALRCTNDTTQSIAWYYDWYDRCCAAKTICYNTPETSPSASAKSRGAIMMRNVAAGACSASPARMSPTARMYRGTCGTTPGAVLVLPSWLIDNLPQRLACGFHTLAAECDFPADATLCARWRRRILQGPPGGAPHGRGESEHPSSCPSFVGGIAFLTRVGRADARSTSSRCGGVPPYWNLIWKVVHNNVIFRVQDVHICW